MPKERLIIPSYPKEGSLSKGGGFLIKVIKARFPYTIIKRKVPYNSQFSKGFLSRGGFFKITIKRRVSYQFSKGSPPKGGLLIIYPWSTKFKEESGDKDIYIGWQLITPPTRNEDDDDKLVYSKALNQPSRELRDAELKELFNLSLFM